MGNTFVGGYWSVTSETATTISANGTYYKIAGTSTYADLAWFSGPSDNATTCDSTTDVLVSATFSGSFTSGNNKSFTIKFRHWDNSASSYTDHTSVVITTNGNGRFESAYMSTPRITVTENDRLEVWIANTTAGGTDVTDPTLVLGGQVQVREYL